jgi:hypothetical protein
VLNEKSDFTMSTWPLGNRNGKINRPLLTFKHKLLTGLPTRNSMQHRKVAMINFLQTRKFKNWIAQFKVRFSADLD